MTRICPDDILALFNSETTISEGRRRAVEWMGTQVTEMRPGDKLLMPDPETGKLIEMEKDRRALQS
jgi:hypothetical protein